MYETVPDITRQHKTPCPQHTNKASQHPWCECVSNNQYRHLLNIQGTQQYLIIHNNKPDNTTEHTRRSTHTITTNKVNPHQHTPQTSAVTHPTRHQHQTHQHNQSVGVESSHLSVSQLCHFRAAVHAHFVLSSLRVAKQASQGSPHASKLIRPPKCWEAFLWYAFARGS